MSLLMRLRARPKPSSALRAKALLGFLALATLGSCSGGGEGGTSTQWTVSTFAGTGQYGSADGTVSTASFANPLSVATDPSGTVFVADSFNHKIRKIANDGTVTTLAGSGVIGSADGAGQSASFNYPTGIATDARGNIYVADSGNFKVRVVSPAGNVTSLAGSGSIGSVDATGTSASFSNLGGLALDAAGNVYVADTGNNTIRKITQSGNVTTIAGTGAVGASNGSALSATFFGLSGIAVDSSGTVYIADSGNGLVRKLSPNGDVSTFAGSGVQAVTDGTGLAASFASPLGLGVDSRGNTFVVDFGRVRMITPDGVVSTVAGSLPFGSSDGVGEAASFSGPTSIAVGPDNRMYVGDGGNSKIRLLVAR
jgi:sugar lactone lactonase YvrE